MMALKRSTVLLIVMSLMFGSLTAMVPISGVAAELDQHWTNATGPLQPGVTIQGYIETEGDVGWHYFYTSDTGQVLVGANAEYGMDFTLYRWDGGYLAREDGIWREGRIDKQLPAGLYYIKVSSGSFSATEPYDITVSGTYAVSGPPTGAQTHPEPILVGEEYKDHWTDATGPMAPTLPYISYIDTQGDVDWYHFYTSDTGQVLVGANAEYGMDFTLYRWDGGHLSREDGIWRRGLIDKQLPAGLYYIKVSSGSFSATEPYDITVSGTYAVSGPPTGAQTHPEPILVGEEYKDHWTDATGPMAPTLPYISYIDTQGDVDWYHFYTSDTGQVLVGANAEYGMDFTLYRWDAGELQREDGIWRRGLIDKQLPAGLYYIKVSSGSFSATEPYDITVSGTATLPSSVNVIPVAGTSRYETAIEASKLAFPDGAETVLIATGRNWPDALGGSALAGALDAPILLVNTDSVPEVVATEIARLKATKAVIVGGSAAVGAPVEAALKATLGDSAVERVWGTDRYLTADAVARRVISELGEAYDGTAFVATGGAYADAVAAGPLAAAKGWPLYLAHPTGGLRTATLSAMTGVTDTLVLGGPAAVSDVTYATLTSRLGATHVTRLAGESRYGTASVVAEHGVANAGLSFDRVGIATGQAYPDALAGGVLQGKVGSVMLLTRTASLPPETAETLLENKAAISTVTYFGGELAVSAQVRAEVGQVLQ